MGGHPEVIGISSDDPQGLLEGHFDLESQPVDSNDLQGIQLQVRAHQQDGPATGMVHGHEADRDTDGAPQEVGHPEADLHPLLAVDRAGGFLQAVGVLQERGDLDLLSVLPGPPLGSWPVGRRRLCREPGHAVALDATYPRSNDLSV